MARGVAFDIEPRLPTFAADAGRVELVVVNLLANAIKLLRSLETSPRRSRRGRLVEHPSTGADSR